MSDPVSTLMAIASLVQHMKAQVTEMKRNKRRAKLLIARIEIILPAVNSVMESVCKGTPLAGERLIGASRFHTYLIELSEFLDSLGRKKWVARLGFASSQGD